MNKKSFFKLFLMCMIACGATQKTHCMFHHTIAITDKNTLSFMEGLKTGLFERFDKFLGKMSPEMVEELQKAMVKIFQLLGNAENTYNKFVRTTAITGVGITSCAVGLNIIQKWINAYPQTPITIVNGVVQDPAENRKYTLKGKIKGILRDQVQPIAGTAFFFAGLLCIVKAGTISAYFTPKIAVTK